MSANMKNRVKGPNAVPDWLLRELTAVRPSEIADMIAEETGRKAGAPVRLVDDQARKPRLAD